MTVHAPTRADQLPVTEDLASLRVFGLADGKVHQTPEGAFLAFLSDENAQQIVAAIEALNYVASDVLAKLKTVDGASSGLDADLLDGNEGSFYAPLNSAALTGAPTAPTPPSSDNSNRLATTAFAKTLFAELVNAAPGTLDTLNELAVALGNDPNFAASMATALAAKAPLASAALTGTPTAPTAAVSTNNTQIATTAFVKLVVAQLVNAAPAALDTLQELAAALGNDSNFANTMVTALAGKADKVDTYTKSETNTAIASAVAAGAGLVLDPVDRVDVLPTLDWRMNSLDGAPFKWTFNRASVGGYRLNNKGVYVPTVANEPIIDFEADGKAKGAGFFGAYSNLIFPSEEFDSALWSKFGAPVVTANNVLAPDGNLTADRIAGSASDCGAARICGGLAIGDTASGSVWLRADSALTVNIYLLETGFNTLLSCNLTTLWQRFEVKRTATVGGNMIFQIGGAGTLTNKTIYAWGAQVTKTANIMPYVPTTSAAASRSADSMSVDGADFADFFNPLEGTFFVTAISPTIGPSAFPWLYAVDDGTSNNRMGAFLYQSTGAMDFVCRVSGSYTGQCSVGAGLTSGQIIRSAASYKANEFRHSVNGGAPVSDLSGVLPTGLDRLRIGSGDLAAGTHISRLIYWPRALTSTKLQEITA